MPGPIEAVVVPPREWWQVLGERRARWWSARPGLAARWSKVRAVGLWVAVLWVLGLLVFVPELRLSVRAYVGVLWAVVAWFALSRTKTLTWSGYMRFFAASLVWSYAIAVLSTIAVGWTSAWGVRASGPSIAIAGVAEECLKIVPVVVLAVLAPRRAARFATVDWALLAIASGGAFLAVEESARRAALMVATGFGVFDRILAEMSGDPVPEGWIRFTWVPVPSTWSEGAAGYGGHLVVTGLLGAVLGLALAAWRHSRNLTGLAARMWQVAAVVAPLLAMWGAVADHAMYNAQFETHVVAPNSGGTPPWLDPGATTIPWWLRVPWSFLGHGHGRVTLFVLAVLACLLVDGHRLSTRPTAGLLGTASPKWVLGWPTRTGSVFGGRLRVLAVPVANVVEGATGLVWVAGRDVRLALASFARIGNEPRGAAVMRGQAIVTAQRAARELVYEQHAEPVDPRAWRLVAGAGLLMLVLASLLLAPVAADAIGHSVVRDVSWLAGVLDALGNWWAGQSLVTQIAIGLGIGALIALSGGSLGLAFGLSGVLTWGLDNAHGLAALARDPRQASRDYWATTTPAQLLVDLLGVVLTFAPGNFAGAAAGRGLRSVLVDILDDPAAWQASRREWVEWQASRTSGDSGAVDLGAFGSRQPGAPATMGWAPRLDYRRTFELANPGVDVSGLVVHHAVEQGVLTRYPGLFHRYEVHSVENLRGIPKTFNNEVHLDQIRRSWNQFYRRFERLGSIPTREELFDHATRIDDELGHLFVPRER